MQRKLQVVDPRSGRSPGRTEQPAMVNKARDQGRAPGSKNSEIRNGPVRDYEPTKDGGRMSTEVHLG